MTLFFKQTMITNRDVLQNKLLYSVFYRHNIVQCHEKQHYCNSIKITEMQTVLQDTSIHTTYSNKQMYKMTVIITKYVGLTV